jgi:hypothetical protein
VPFPSPLQAVGVGKWAWRRGHQYGTIFVELATHRVVDLLLDRSAATVAAWFAQHPSIAVIGRDRSPLYADGIRQGAPKAVQVVDRFHLVQNLREAIEAFLVTRRPVLQAAAVHTARALTSAAARLPRPGSPGLAPRIVVSTARERTVGPGLLAPLVITKNAVDPTLFTSVGNEADRVELA